MYTKISHLLHKHGLVRRLVQKNHAERKMFIFKILKSYQIKNGEHCYFRAKITIFIHRWSIAIFPRDILFRIFELKIDKFSTKIGPQIKWL